MTTIRAFEKRDIPEVCELFQHLLLKDNPSRRELTNEHLANYFEEICFNHPNYDVEISSLVSRDSNGKITGFLGIIPRQMMFHGQPIRAAISFFHMVNPEFRSSMAGVKLLKKLFSGPQDLSITDGAGDLGHRVWVSSGGYDLPLYSLQWEKILQPGRLSVELVGKRLPIENILSPIAKIADLVATKLLPSFLPRYTTEDNNVHFLTEDCNPDTIVNLMAEWRSKDSHHVVYDEASLKWVLKQADQFKSHGTLKKVTLQNLEGGILGLGFYYAKRGKRCPLLHIETKNGLMDKMLKLLFIHAEKQGVTALYGRLNPNNLQHFAGIGCFFHVGAKTLVHSHNKDILNLFKYGEVNWSRIDGEWLLHY